MPYKWVKPDLYLEYFGVRIFHAYNNSNQRAPLNNWFTTHNGESECSWEFDVRDLGELSEMNLAAGRDESDDTDTAIKEAIKRAIECQAIKLPVDDGIDYPFKRGSFNWYANHPNVFIQRLASAVMIADVSNKSRLDKVYHHMVESNSSGNYDTVFDGDIIDGPMFLGKRASINEPGEFCEGSFFWYLKKSGSFVTNMANVIAHADNENVEIIKMIYPQMVAAFKRPDWNITPLGFKPVYNAGVG